MTNRAKLARERAGLSLGQACKLLGIERAAMTAIEEGDDAFLAAGDSVRAQLAEAYGVKLEWLAGECPRYDYAAVDAMRGADRLSFHDRDVVAEFAASLPSRRSS